MQLSNKTEIGIIQIDAHADLREKYDNEVHSHASVMYLLSQEKYKIAQCGVRALSLEEVNNQIKFEILSFGVNDIQQNNEVKLPENFPEIIYISFDLDGLDPSIMPATGTPEPGGLLWDETLNIIRIAAKNSNIVGADINELAPIKGFNSYNFLVAKLAYKILTYKYLY